MSRRRLSVDLRVWPLAEPFAISRGVDHEARAIEVTLAQDGRRGRGEACGVDDAGETPESLRQQIETVRAEIEAGAGRLDLLDLLPAGGARCAVDAALWDLEAKMGQGSPFARCGLAPRPVLSARTIGIRSVAGYAQAARALADWGLIKIKVASEGAAEAVRAVRDSAPGARLIVDPNQAWTAQTLRALAPAMAGLGVDLLEQPVAVGAEADLDGWASPLPLCADELIQGEADLSRAEGRFAYVNIKLDKTGGLTAALRLADRAEAMGFRLMAGCMGGSSLGMAPAMVLAQRCAYADLDGPLLQIGDREPSFRYDRGWVSRPHLPDLWG